MPINKPYILFLGDAPDQLAAKTASGVAYWRRCDCLGQLRLPNCNAKDTEDRLGLPCVDAVRTGVSLLVDRIQG